LASDQYLLRRLFPQLRREPLNHLQIAHAADVRRYGAVGDGVTDDTEAIQAAIDTGLDVYFPKGTYRAHTLTQSTINQVFRGEGAASSVIVKNANGALLTSTARDVQLRNMSFQGRLSDEAASTYSGDNVVFSGNNCSMINCGSYFAAGRAVKATGGQFQIKGGRSEIYHTDDATASGYDIELGVSGGASSAAIPYCMIEGIVTTHAAGGILLVDTGSCMITNCQFGKLTIQRGTGPSGVNGGITIGCRILGAVTVEASSAVFVGNQFSSASSVTFALGTSACALDQSNVFDTTFNADWTYASGCRVTNNGNANNLVIRNVSTGSDIKLKYGDDSSSTPLVITYDPANGLTTFNRHVYAANGYSFRAKGIGSGDARFYMDAGASAYLVSDVSGGDFNIHPTGTGAIRISTSSGKLGFHGVSPSTQQVLATGTGKTVDNVITLLQLLGLCKQS